MRSVPCPFFEPLTIAACSHRSGARLPLIDEYDGLCHAGSTPLAVPVELRFSHCNHGYCGKTCAHFPAQSRCSAVRFDVVSRDPEALCVMYVEEADHAPQTWQRVKYSIATGLLEPALPSSCAEAQVRAFCLSFLGRFR